jgi:ribonuclease HI
MHSASLSLNIMQWNVCSLSARHYELKKYLSDCKSVPDVVCINETRLKENTKFNLFNYEVVRHDRKDSGGGGIATFIRSGLCYRVLETPSPSIECLAIEITLKNIKIVVVNVYIPPLLDVDIVEFKKLFMYKHCIITGDINAYNTLWKSSVINSMGKKVETCLDEYNFCVLNKGEGTHQKHQGGMSVIDLSIVSCDLANRCNFTVHDDPMGSDHLPTFTVLNEPVNFEAQYRDKWNLNKADWSVFKCKCLEYINDDILNNDVEESWQGLSEGINKAAEASIPKVINKENKKYKKLPFWSEDCSKQIKIRNAARNKSNRTKLPADCANYRKQKGIAQKMIKMAAQNYWQNYCDSLNQNTKLNSVWRIAKKMTGSSGNFRVTTLKKANNFYDTNEAKADLLAEVFANSSSNNNYSPTFLQHKDQFEAENKEEYTNLPDSIDQSPVLNVPLNLQELNDAIHNCKSDTSPGDDSIPYELIKNLPPSSVCVVLALFNLIWSSGSTPLSWNHAIIIPILKPGKPASDPNSYRPISLTSTFCKLMERIITNRLNWYLEINGLLTNAQTGFRKGRSTMDQCVRLQDTIHKFNSNKGFTVGVFLDFEKAYDMLWRVGLLTKIKKLGITGNIFKFINNFIQNRTMQVQIGNKRSKRIVLENGTPQGSVISPVLFLIMINDMTVNSENNVELSLFADDSSTFKSGSNLDLLCKHIQISLDMISSWCDQWGFKISVDKSTGVVFTHKYSYNIKKPLMINGSKLKMDTKVKFLGMFFDSKLNWVEHVKYVVGKCSKRLNLMRSLTGTSFGANKKCLLTIYNILIRSVLDYGAIVYDTASQTTKNMIENIQNRALSICCGSMKGTPVAALQVECGEMPLRLRRLKQQIKYAIKVKSDKNHPAAKVFKPHWTNQYGSFNEERTPLFTKVTEFFDMCKLNIEQIVTDSDPPWQRKQIAIDVSLTKCITKKDSPLIIKTFALEMQEKYKHYFSIYTDGSKSVEGIVASSFVIPELNIQFKCRISNNSSVFTAELIALEQCVEWLVVNVNSEALIGVSKVIIYSDSLSSIIAINKGMSHTRPKLVSKIINIIKSITNKEIIIAWIPSHVDIKGNELADRLAKEGLSAPSVEKVVEFENQELIEQVDVYIRNKWQELWDTGDTARFYNEIEPKVSEKIKYCCKIRKKEVKLTRLRMGHCKLNYNLFEISCHDTGQCDACGLNETVHHYLLNCTGNDIKDHLRTFCKQHNVSCITKNVLCNKEGILDKIYPFLTRDL